MTPMNSQISSVTNQSMKSHETQIQIHSDMILLKALKPIDINYSDQVSGGWYELRIEKLMV